jgi:hypothetical protein
VTTDSKSLQMGRLERKADGLRRRLVWHIGQLREIHTLYAEYVELGCAFPADLEEHSLWLILKFLRPDDDGAARRLVAVLQAQGKPVPPELRARATRHVLSSPEQMAEERRRQAEENRAAGKLPPLHERLTFVMGLPKSASRLMVSVLATMHPDERYRKAATLPYSTGIVGYDATADLRYDELLKFDGGGVVHSHASASCVNRHALAGLGLGHVVTVRHPADHIAALYCHIRRLVRMLPPHLIADLPRPRAPELSQLSDPSAASQRYATEGQSDLITHAVIFPVDPRYFLPSAEVDDAIAHMIVGGYLFHALAWIVSWQLMRVRNVSIIVRYEDFIGAPEETLRRVSQAILGSESPQAIARGRSAMSGKAYESRPDPNVYPRGSTGASGVWTQYLSPTNRRLYNAVCERFVAAHPYGSLLTALYDDLLIEIED